jgi:hypothetical protein
MSADLRNHRAVAPVSRPGLSTGLEPSSPRGVILLLHRLDLDELLPAVDVERRTRDRGVHHQIDGENGDICCPDDAPNWQRRAQLLASGVQLLPEKRGGERSLDESRRDEIHANRGKLQGEAPDYRRQGNGDGGDERQVRRLVP